MASRFNISSKFRPYSFDELLKPVLMATEAHQQLENEYSNIDAKASVWEKLANDVRDKDSKAYERYKGFSDALREKASTLALSGLSPSSRRDLMEMKSKYSSDIIPIEEAYKKRQELADEQRKLLAQDNSLMFDRNISLSNIDDFIDNPNLSYTPVSGKEITKRVAGALSNYKKTFRNVSNWSSTASGQLLERIITKGLTREDLNTIVNNPDAFPDIQRIIKDTVETTGVQNWNNKEALEKAYQYAYEGLPYGLGDSDITVRENKDYISPYERWKINKENTPKDPYNNRLFTFEGTTITPDKDYQYKKMNEDMDNLNSIREALLRGESIDKTITSEQYRDPGLNTIHNKWMNLREELLNKGMREDELSSVPAYSALSNIYKTELERVKRVTPSNIPITITKEVKNPLYETYERLSEQYKDTNVDNLIRHHKEESKKKASINKFAYLHSGASNLLNRYLTTSAFQGIDLEDSKEVGKIIHKLGDKKDIPTKENLHEIFSPDTRLGINPVTKEVRLFNPKLGTYVLNPTVFHSLNVVTNSGSSAGDKYLDDLSNKYINEYSEDGSTRYGKENYYRDINNFFESIITLYNSGVQEAPTTNSKASLYIPD